MNAAGAGRYEMIGPKLVTTSVKHIWAGVVIIAAVLVVAGCKLPGAEHTALPATSTPAASPAGTGLPPATVTTVQSKDIGASAGRGATPAARAPAARAVATPAPTAIKEVHILRSSACTDGLEPMRQYASDDVARWTADGNHILLTYNAEVWAVTPDGSRLWRLARAWGQTEPGTDFTFGWMTSFDVTPDGQHIAYATCAYPPDLPRAALTGAEGAFRFDYELAAVGLDGQAPRQLTRHEAFDNYPAWSPDGTRVAFVSNRDVPDIEKIWRAGLYMMAADGADVRRLATGLEGVAWQPPAWSPDGRSIAVAGVEPGEAGHGLYQVHTDGAGFVRLSEAVSGGSWSLDGTRLAFAKPEGAVVALYTIAADGSDARRVTTISGWQRRQTVPEATRAWIPTVAWSPDGAKLLYSCWPRQFCVVTLDGEPVGEAPLLSETPLRGDSAVWSPDGGRIAVAATQDRDERIVLYSAAPDGSDVKPLALGGDAGLVAAQARDEDLATSRAACAAGFVVPAPDANPGLVQDCTTLLAARAALFGELLVNWGSGTPLERWTGVTVTGVPPRVIGLDLHYAVRWFTRRNSVVQERLRGTIPPALGALERLQRLNLAGNALSGPIPPELGALSHLTELRLGLNRLKGPIPTELGQLTNLTVLELGRGQGNQLTGEIPDALTRLRNLKQLYLDGADNRLTGCIPSGLRRVERHDLEELGLPDCEAAS